MELVEIFRGTCLIPFKPPYAAAYSVVSSKRNISIDRSDGGAAHKDQREKVFANDRKNVGE
ncbi:MAG: hypothetical protein C0399_11650 [Syntrophus sp. (in: bacteria)]|nr:hypothetical protein [Syntrophus sp. (in: bacteria)]